MFSSTGVLVRSGILVRNRTFSTSLINRNKRKFKLKGVVFLTMSIVVFVTGTVMTVLGFVNDFFGSGLIMLGMLMIVVAVLQFMCALRQFLMFRKVMQTNREAAASAIPTAAMVIERDHENDTLTIVMDTVTCEQRPHSRSHSRQSFCNDSLPPCYMDATSDYYTETPMEIVVDDMEEPPPPYGPPTYDEAVAQPRETMESIQEPNRDPSGESTGHVTGSDDHVTGNEGHVTEEAGEPKTNTETRTVPPSVPEHSVIYQDFTNVTI